MKIVFFLFILFINQIYGDELDFEITTHYFHSIKFNNKNIPVISILISNQSTAYNIISNGDFEIQYKDDDNKIKAIKSRDAVIKRGNFHSGKIIYKLIVDKVNFNDKGTLDQSVERFKNMGFTTESIVIGSIFGLQGRIYDNRQYYLSIATFDKKDEAHSLMSEIYEKHKIRTYLLPVIKRYPSGKIKILIRDKKMIIQADSIVWIRQGKERLTLVDEAKKLSYGIFNGDFYFTFDSDGSLAAINRIDLEELLRGIVPSETYASAPLDALKAQSVAARTEILSAIGHRHPATPYLLCATQHCQVYNGVNSYTGSTDEAIKETFGEVMLFEKRFVKAVYSSNCGGYSEDNNVVWNEHLEPYLVSRPDSDENSEFYKKYKEGITEDNIEEFLYTTDESYCARSSYNNKKAYRWKIEINYDELIKLVQKRFDIKEINDIVIEGRGKSGRIRGITIVSGKKRYYIDTEFNIRQLFGGLKSGLMIIEKKVSQEGKLLGLIFTGGGWGHGVGMCQTGAIGMAEQGFSYKDILLHYYKDVTIEKVY
ncbi:MAG: SpoIID/LytB domain-containing protein [Deltaproteobacteria bacterium]|nr:SpoIID/LytB domain-containing protein [Deltaproteobacteria bacterium]